MESRTTGHAEGHAIGRMEAHFYDIISLIMKKLKKGKAIAAIADDLECEVDEIFTLVEIVQKYAPEYQVDEIVKECMDNNTRINLKIFT